MRRIITGNYQLVYMITRKMGAKEGGREGYRERVREIEGNRERDGE